MVRPIVQVSLRDFANRKHDISAELLRAATDVGFFYLCDTGISEVSAAAPLSLTSWR